MPRGRFDDKAVLVTGAGSGIGRETSLAFAARGARLFLCDVNEEGLAETVATARRSGVPVDSRVVDVANRGAMRAFAEVVHTHVPAVDVLVNNAGVGLGGGFLETTLEDWEWVISINLWGVIHGCHFFLPPMVKKKHGSVINVSSAAGFLATPDLAAYATTKYGVFGLSEALREELRPHGIAVSTICPGIVNTPITRSARLRGVHEGSRERMVKIYERRNYGPEKVAAVIVDAAVKGKAVVPVTPEAWIAYALKRALPESTPRLLGRLVERRLARAAKDEKK